jgi:hypothetical protein
MKNNKNGSVKNYSFIISPQINHKLSKHLTSLKMIKGNLKKSEWLVNAIKEKLNRDNCGEIIQKEMRINLPIDEETLERLESNVKMTGKFRTSFSKKQWIVEAILEQLEKESHEVRSFAKQALQEMNEQS